MSFVTREAILQSNTPNAALSPPPPLPLPPLPLPLARSLAASGTTTVVVDDDELGSVGRAILSVHEVFSETATTRRGVVYAAGILVLIMSVVYVGVGYYALRKDGGQGKDGGARMRG